MINYNKEIIKLAKKSLDNCDVPVGAIIVYNNKIIGKGYNSREKNQNILGHAEINAVKKASRYLNNWNLSGCTMYVTLKPCNMCMEIIKQSRIANVYYLLDKPATKKEFAKTKLELIDNENYKRLYSDILSNFFVNFRYFHIITIVNRYF